MYPLKFEPVLKQTLWGGDKIIPFKHLNENLPNVGESWEVSAVEGSESVVANGADKGLTLPEWYVSIGKNWLASRIMHVLAINSLCWLSLLMRGKNCLFKFIQAMNWPKNVITVLVKMKCGMLFLPMKGPL